jgi:hypothetical protein
MTLKTSRPISSLNMKLVWDVSETLSPSIEFLRLVSRSHVLLILKDINTSVYRINCSRWKRRLREMFWILIRYSHRRKPKKTSLLTVVGRNLCLELFYSINISSSSRVIGHKVVLWKHKESLNIVTCRGFAWLIRRVLDLIIQFIRPWYNWLTTVHKSLSNTLDTPLELFSLPTELNWTVNSKSKSHCDWR